MKAFVTLILTMILAIPLCACGCSNSVMGDTQTPGTTLLPDILPTLETNIPDSEVDTQMPIYTEGIDGVLPSENQTETTK